MMVFEVIWNLAWLKTIPVSDCWVMLDFILDVIILNNSVSQNFMCFFKILKLFQS
jgi:hypothetical protein